MRDFNMPKPRPITPHAAKAAIAGVRRRCPGLALSAVYRIAARDLGTDAATLARAAASDGVRGLVPSGRAAKVQPLQG